MAENRSMKTSQVAIGTLRQGGGLNPWWHWKMRNGRILDPHSTQGPGFADGLSLGCRSKRGVKVPLRWNCHYLRRRLWTKQIWVRGRAEIRNSLLAMLILKYMLDI